MGRPEEPIERDGSPVREFAFWLRDLRRTADLTYDNMRKPTGYAPSTLQEACGGRRLPTLRVTVAFVSACGGDVEAWKDYWQTIRRASDPRSPAGPTGSVRRGPSRSKKKEQDEPAAEPNPVPTRRRRPLVAAATVAVIVIAAVLVIVLRHGGSTATAVPRVAASRTTSAPAAAGAGAGTRSLAEPTAARRPWVQGIPDAPWRRRGPRRSRTRTA